MGDFRSVVVGSSLERNPEVSMFRINLLHMWSLRAVRVVTPAVRRFQVSEDTPGKMTASALFWIDSITSSMYNGIFAHAGTAYSRMLHIRLIYTLTCHTWGHRLS